MNFDSTSIFLIAAICVVIGFFIGRLVSSLRESQKPDSTHPDWDEVLQVWRDPRKDDLIVTIQDDAYERGRDIDPKSRNMIHQALMQLLHWLDPKRPGPAAEDVKEIPSGTPASIPPDYPLELPEPVETNKPRQIFNPRNALANAMLFDIPDSAFKPESIVEQIDNILQLVLKESDMEESAVRLMDMPGKGMVVVIGLDMYDEIDDIPDGQIKSLIRQSVWLWENRKERPDE